MTPADRIRQIQTSGYAFSLGRYLERGFQLFGKQAGLFIAFTLLYLLIAVVASVIPLVGTLVVNVLLAPCLTAGYFLVAHKIVKGDRDISLNDFFKGFDYAGPLAGVTVMTFLVIGATALPFVSLMFISNFQEFYLLFFALLIPTFYFIIAYAAAPLFVVFYRMEGWQAMEASRKIITKKWFHVFLMAIVMALVAAMGTMVFFVGLLAAIPAIACIQYAAFADIMKLPAQTDDDDMDDEILKHLV